MTRNKKNYEPFLFLYITERCQLNCKHCYMGDRLEGEKDMSVDYIKNVLQLMKTIYGHYKVYLLGGEPTLHPKLSQILKICKEEDFSVVLNSNGLISKEGWEKITPKKIDSLSFSMDGASKETHEFLRGKGTFSTLLENIKKAKEKNFNTRLVCTINKRNKEEVLDIIKLADDLQVKLLSFHYFTPTGSGKNNPNLQLSNKEWRLFTDVLKKHTSDIVSENGVKVYYPPAFVSKDEIETIREAGYKGCPARNLERIAVFPDERCYICSAFLDKKNNFAQVNDQGFSVNKIENNELDIINQIAEKCTKCNYNSICKGGCPAYDYFGYGISTKNCDKELIPICPLWTMSINDSEQEDLR